MKNKFRLYNGKQDFPSFGMLMPAKPSSAFGQHLAALRKAHGFSQKEFAQEVDLSPRMMAYYETEGGNPPLPLLPKFAKALNLTLDEIFGLAKPTPVPKAGTSRLARRLSQIEKLPAKKRRQLVQLMDAFLER